MRGWLELHEVMIHNQRRSSHYGKTSNEREARMTIQIQQPELEALIEQRLESGAFRDVEDVLLQALRAYEPEAKTSEPAGKPKSLVEVFAPLRGLDLDWGRNPSTGRPVER